MLLLDPLTQHGKCLPWLRAMHMLPLELRAGRLSADALTLECTDRCLNPGIIVEGLVPLSHYSVIEGLQPQSALKTLSLARSGLIKFRRAHALLGRAEFLAPADITWHEDHWDNPESKFLAFSLHDRRAPLAGSYRSDCASFTGSTEHRKGNPSHPRPRRQCISKPGHHLA